MQARDFLAVADLLPEALILICTTGEIIAINNKAKKLLGIEDAGPGQNLNQFVSTPKDKLTSMLRTWSRSDSPVPANLQWNTLSTKQITDLQCQAFLFQPASDKRLAQLVLRCVSGRSMARSFLELNSELERHKIILNKLQQSRNALEMEHEKALVTLHSIGDAVITTNNQGTVEYLNPVAEKLTGWKNDDASGMHITKVFHIVNETTRQQALDPIMRSLEEGQIVGLANHTVLISKDGADYVIEDSAAPIKTHDDVLGVVLVFRDVTSDRLARRQLEYLAQHDSLTGLKNRFFFEQQLERVVDLAARGKHRSALLYIDLDQFKIVNDTAGHAAGDDLLMEVAHMLSERIRQGDILARLGGDEFGVIIDYTEREELQEIAKSFSQDLHGHIFKWDENEYDVTCSIGIVIINEHTKSSAEAMRQADIACYVAKEEGRNRFHVYTVEDESSKVLLSEINVVKTLKSALENNNFVLYFQPIRNLADDKIVSHEILLRMLDSDNSIIMPNNFIPIAERNSIMPSIDKWVLEKSIQLIIDRDKNNKESHFTINLSGQSLGEPEILNIIKNFIKKYPGLADTMVIEITETSAVKHLDKASMFIKELHDLGVCFALDDFGTGFSSFAYLKHLPVDYIKIDGAFVRDILKDPVNQAMVRSMNHIAHSLGKQTVAEFVESSEIFDLLKEIGVDMVQGYYIGEPVSELQDN